MHQDSIKHRFLNNEWILRVIALLLVAIAIQNILVSYIAGLLAWFKIISIRHWLFEPAWQVQSSILLAIAFAIYWNWKERRSQVRSLLIHARLQEIIRFWLALSISSYGFSKVFGLQFGITVHHSDYVARHLTGMNLTWYYFSQSYTLGLIIGLVQVGGSVLLLFRRTMLIGVLILLPVLANIVLLNHFIGIPKPAYYNSIIFTAGLLYLFLLRWEIIKTILVKSVSDSPPLKSVFIKSVGRLIAIGLPCAVVVGFWIAQPPVSPLRGKWQVDEFVRNGDTVRDNSWVTDNNVWKNIYIEDFGRLLLSPNPYIYEFDRVQDATFKFDPLKQQLHVIIQTGWTVSDTILVKMSNYDSHKMEWNTVLRKDTLNLKLSKVSR